MYQNSKESSDSDNRLFAWAKSYLDLKKNIQKVYISKYERYKINSNPENLYIEEAIAPILKEKFGGVEEILCGRNRCF